MYHGCYFLIDASLSFIDGNLFFRFHTNLVSTMSSFSIKTGYRIILRSITVFVFMFFMKCYIIWQIVDLDSPYKHFILFGFLTKRIGLFSNGMIRSIIFEWALFSTKTLRISFEKLVFKSNQTVSNLEPKDILRVVVTYAKLLENINSVGLTLKIMMLKDCIFTFYYVILVAVGLVFAPDFSWETFTVKVVLKFLIDASLSFIDGNLFFRFHTNLVSTMTSFSIKTGYRIILRSITVFVFMFFMKCYIIWQIVDLDSPYKHFILFGFLTKRIGLFFNGMIRSIIFEWALFSTKTLRISFEKLVFKSNETISNLEPKDILRVIVTYAKLLENINSVGLTLKIMMLKDCIFIFYYVILVAVGLVFAPDYSIAKSAL
ncbi:uncharacterized protein LOC125051990 [Pieris napi]|uniref:uncharacterized protein LOC125051990 n=1 Tax=Pieris napi TaxID=78633 RepID=UPI001FB866CC|nr:uncharacterized protein LOC125051990 [Pieris napi]